MNTWRKLFTTLMNLETCFWPSIPRPLSMIRSSFTGCGYLSCFTPHILNNFQVTSLSTVVKWPTSCRWARKSLHQNQFCIFFGFRSFNLWDITCWIFNGVPIEDLFYHSYPHHKMMQVQRASIHEMYEYIKYPK